MWQPAPFQSPLIGLGSKLQTTPKSSATRQRRYLATKFETNWWKFFLPSHPELITHLNSLARSNLELPLGGHDLGVGARDLDAGVKTRSVVSFDDVSTVDVVGADSAVVRSLGSWVSLLGPSVWVTVNIEHSPFWKFMIVGYQAIW